LLASLEKRSSHRELGYFLEAGNGNNFEGEVLVDKATRGGFALFWEAAAEPEMEVFPCFQE